MKICVLTNMHPIKDDRIYYKQVLSLAKRYSDLTLIAPKENGWPQALHPSVRYKPLPKTPGLVGRLRSILTAAIFVRQIKPDVCHFHDYDLVLAVPLIRALTGAKIIYDAHEAYPEMFKLSSRVPPALRTLGAWVVNFVEKSLTQLCALVITADEATAKAFRKYNIPASTVFNFPPLGLFESDSQMEAALKRRYTGRTLLIYQGTMSEDRGLFHMLRAMDMIHRKDPSILLLLIGLDVPELLQRTKETIDRLNIADAVEILPWVDHEKIGSYMRICDIGLIPWQPCEKYQMNLPIKLFEYMACGLPVLSANLRPIASFLSPSGAGRLYDSTDDRALAEAVRDMLANPEKLERMRARGLEAVQSQWNWSKMEQKLLKIYDGMSSGSKRIMVANGHVSSGHDAR
jgi:glycosyltransferase involved in cell wall biosynthesis